MSRIGEYYRPSRTLDPTGLLIFLVFSLAPAPEIGSVYGLVQTVIGKGLVKLIVPIGFVVAVSFIIGLGTRLGKRGH